MSTLRQGATEADATLGADQVRSWRVARHHLDGRVPRSRLEDVVERVCGVHAQVMSAAELSLWARLDGIDRDDVRDALWERRTLVRTWCMRGTLHLLRSTDLPLYVAALATHPRWSRASWLRFMELTADELEAAIEAIRTSLGARPLTREELTEKVTRKVGPHLRERMASGWGELLKPAAFRGYLCSGPDRGRNVTFVRPDRWLGRWSRMDGEAALREIARRFLSSYGPATHDDFARWWGIDPGPMRRLFQRMTDELAEVVVGGRRSWANAADVPRMKRLAPRSDVRLLPNFDAYVMGFRPRDELVPPEHGDLVFRKAGWISPVVLVDGRIAGVWEQAREKRRLRLTVRPFSRLGASLRSGVEGEADRLGSFLDAPVEVSFARAAA